VPHWLSRVGVLLMTSAADVAHTILVQFSWPAVRSIRRLRTGQQPPEVARKVARGRGEARDHRFVIALIVYDRGSGRGGMSRRLTFGTRPLAGPWPGSMLRRATDRWSLASLGPPATVRVASGDEIQPIFDRSVLARLGKTELTPSGTASPRSRNRRSPMRRGSPDRQCVPRAMRRR
jgi:hypothetical protein